MGSEVWGGVPDWGDIERGARKEVFSPQSHCVLAHGLIHMESN